MKTKMYSIFDKQACYYCPPFFAKTDGEAQRLVYDAVVYGEENMLRKYPTDFSLCLIGSFDDSTGSFDSLIQPQVLLGNLVFAEVIKDDTNL